MNTQIKQAIAYIGTMQAEHRTQDYEYETIYNVLMKAYDQDWADAHEESPASSGDYLACDERGKIEICQYREKTQEWFRTKWIEEHYGKTIIGIEQANIGYWRLLPDAPRSNN